jgi:hypothetical protein
VFVLLAFASTVHGTTIVVPSDAKSRADMVLDVRIVRQERLSVDGSYCGTRYTAAIEKVVKGDGSLKTIAFGRAAGLKNGNALRVYLVHLTSVADLRNINPNMTIEPASPHEVKMLECNGLVPGYEMVGRSSSPQPKAK